jgi:hypothetical protein
MKFQLHACLIAWSVAPHIFLGSAFTTSQTTTPLLIRSDPVVAESSFPRRLASPRQRSLRLHYANPRNGNHNNSLNDANPHEILNLMEEQRMSPNGVIDKKVLKDRYKIMALQYHPDIVTNIESTPEERKDASDRFAIINWAYATLQEEADQAATGYSVTTAKRVTQVDSQFSSWFTDTTSSYYQPSSFGTPQPTFAGYSGIPSSIGGEHKAATSYSAGAAEGWYDRSYYEQDEDTRGNSWNRTPWHEQSTPTTRRTSSSSWEAGASTSASSSPSGPPQPTQDHRVTDATTASSTPSAHGHAQPSAGSTHSYQSRDQVGTNHNQEVERQRSASSNQETRTSVSSSYIPRPVGGFIPTTGNSVYGHTEPSSGFTQSNQSRGQDTTNHNQKGARQRSASSNQETRTTVSSSYFPRPVGGSIPTAEKSPSAHGHSEPTAGSTHSNQSRDQDATNHNQEAARQKSASSQQETRTTVSSSYFPRPVGGNIPTTHIPTTEVAGGKFHSVPPGRQAPGRQEVRWEPASQATHASTQSTSVQDAARPTNPQSSGPNQEEATSASNRHGHVETPSPTRRNQHIQDEEDLCHKSFFHNSAFVSTGSSPKRSSANFARAAQDGVVDQKVTQKNMETPRPRQESSNAYAPPRSSASTHATTDPRRSDPEPVSTFASKPAPGARSPSHQDNEGHKSFWYKSAFETVGKSTRSAPTPPSTSSAAHVSTADHNSMHQKTENVNVGKKEKGDFYATQQQARAPGQVWRSMSTPPSEPVPESTQEHARTAGNPRTSSPQHHEDPQHKSFFHNSAFVSIGNSPKSSSSSFSRMSQDGAVVGNTPPQNTGSQENGKGFAPRNHASTHAQDSRTAETLPSEPVPKSTQDHSRSAASPRTSKHLDVEGARHKSFFHNSAFGSTGSSPKSSSSFARAAQDGVVDQEVAQQSMETARPRQQSNNAYAPQPRSGASSHATTVPRRSDPEPVSTFASKPAPNTKDPSRNPAGARSPSHQDNQGHKSFWYKSAFETVGKSMRSTSAPPTPPSTSSVTEVGSADHNSMHQKTENVNVGKKEKDNFDATQQQSRGLSQDWRTAPTPPSEPVPESTQEHARTTAGPRTSPPQHQEDPQHKSFFHNSAFVGIGNSPKSSSSSFSRMSQDGAVAGYAPPQNNGIQGNGKVDAPPHGAPTHAHDSRMAEKQPSEPVPESTQEHAWTTAGPRTSSPQHHEDPQHKSFFHNSAFVSIGNSPKSSSSSFSRMSQDGAVVGHTPPQNNGIRENGKVDAQPHGAPTHAHDSRIAEKQPSEPVPESTQEHAWTTAGSRTSSPQHHEDPQHKSFFHNSAFVGIGNSPKSSSSSFSRMSQDGAVAGYAPPQNNGIQGNGKVDAPPHGAPTHAHDSRMAEKQPSEPVPESTQEHAWTTAGPRTSSPQHHEDPQHKSFFHNSAFVSIGNSPKSSSSSFSRMSQDGAVVGHTPPQSLVNQKSTQKSTRSSSPPITSGVTEHSSVGRKSMHQMASNIGAGGRENVSFDAPRQEPCLDNHASRSAGTRHSQPGPESTQEHIQTAASAQRSNHQYDEDARHKSFWYNSAFVSPGSCPKSSSSSFSRAAQDGVVKSMEPPRATEHEPRQSASTPPYDIRTSGAPLSEPTSDSTITSTSSPSTHGHSGTAAAPGRSYPSSQGDEDAGHKSFWQKSAFDNSGQSRSVKGNNWVDRAMHKKSGQANEDSGRASDRTSRSASSSPVETALDSISSPGSAHDSSSVPGYVTRPPKSTITKSADSWLDLTHGAMAAEDEWSAWIEASQGPQVTNTSSDAKATASPSSSYGPSSSNAGTRLPHTNGGSLDRDGLWKSEYGEDVDDRAALCTATPLGHRTLATASLSAAYATPVSVSVKSAVGEARTSQHYYKGVDW